MSVLDLQSMKQKAPASGAGARNSGASKGCFLGGSAGEGPSTLSLLLC
ncbi:MAG TPA: SapB/AmfS family lanthipeptide [Acidimicrobiales bacterium]